MPPQLEVNCLLRTKGREAKHIVILKKSVILALEHIVQWCHILNHMVTEAPPFLSPPPPPPLIASFSRVHLMKGAGGFAVDATLSAHQLWLLETGNSGLTWWPRPRFLQTQVEDRSSGPTARAKIAAASSDLVREKNEYDKSYRLIINMLKRAGPTFAVYGLEELCGHLETGLPGKKVVRA